MTQGRMDTMTEGTGGFWWKRLRALMASKRRASFGTLFASLSVGLLLSTASSGFAKGLDQTVIVTNQGALLAGNIATFPPSRVSNAKPTFVIQGADITFFGSPVPGENVLTGVGVSPFPVGGVTNGIYALSNLSFLAPGAPDVIGGWAPNSTGNTQAFAGLITFSLDLGPPIGVVDFIPLHLPQAITFLSVAPEDILPLGTFYVSNLVGGAGLGSVIMFPPDAGTPGNPLGTLNGLPAPVLSDLTCAAGAPTTGLLLPVGV